MSLGSPPQDPAAQVRWRRWQARASRQDRRSRMWCRAVAVVVFVLLGAWLAMEFTALQQTRSAEARTADIPLLHEAVAP